MDFGPLVKQARKASGYTQSEIATCADVNGIDYSQFEDDNLTVDLEIVDDLTYKIFQKVFCVNPLSSGTMFQIPETLDRRIFLERMFEMEFNGRWRLLGDFVMFEEDQDQIAADLKFTGALLPLV